MYSNIILSADSYKYSQFNQYPEGTEQVYSYIQSRGSEKYAEGVFLGWQMFAIQYLSNPITIADIDEAEAIITAHGLPFFREGWEYIIDEHSGKLPIEVRTVDEGTLFSPTANVPLLTITNTDPKAYWLVSFLETAILRAIWYPTTVASNSFATRSVIKSFLVETGDITTLDFKLHDFGARGVSSAESSGIGGLAHLATGFMGTDNITALLAARRYYNADMAGFSIPAMEHSTVTSWGRDNEVDSYRNMLKLYGQSGKLFAAVSDSYNIYEAVSKLWGGELKDEVIASGATVVIRPDSGTPHVIVTDVAKLLAEKFGTTTNSKGYKVLNNVRIIQGDGINTLEVFRILQNLRMAGFSADNVAFGQGGALLQQLDRDTMRFAMKCSAIKVNGEWRDVYKDPITDSGKRSLKGRFSPEYVSDSGKVHKLTLRYRNGSRCNKTDLAKIRALVNA